MTGFAIGPTTMPCTKGLWIWGKPVDIDQDSVLIIMDTEGLNSVHNFIYLLRKRYQCRFKNLCTFHLTIFSFYLQFVKFY